MIAVEVKGIEITSLASFIKVSGATSSLIKIKLEFNFILFINYYFSYDSYDLFYLLIVDNFYLEESQFFFFALKLQ